ncbi:MAG: hypothetical protein IT449_07375 [Phycisphaerales bacterium]|nr:hypothetical protein [Phycisphaerales bacterium]
MNPQVIVILSDTALTAVHLDAQPPRLARRAFTLADSLFALDNLEALAVAIREALTALDATESPATLVIPLNWAFTHVLQAGQRTSDEALAFELEPFLPVPLEELTCTFARRGKRALGLAVATEPMRALLSAMERQGVSVEHIFVDAVVVGLQAKEGEGKAAILDRRWTRGFTLDDEWPLPLLFGSSDEHPPRTSDPRWPSENQGSWELLDLRETGPLPESDRELVESDAALRRIAHAVCNLEETDLRVGALASRGRWSHVEKRAQLALTSAILLLVAVLAGLHQKAASLSDQAASLEHAQLQVYRQVYPVEALPPGAALRLASERKRLEGLTRSSEQVPDSPAQEPLDAFRGFVAELPPDVRIFLDQIRLDENQMALRGTTAEHRDAERIAEALSRVPGIESRPPRTTRLSEGGVEFSVLARRQNHD